MNRESMLKRGILLASLIGVWFSAWADVKVKGYYRSDGTYVAPHYRSSPNSTVNDNWTTYGNVNPHTGEKGTRKFYDSGSSYPLPEDPTDYYAEGEVLLKELKMTASKFLQINGQTASQRLASYNMNAREYLEAKRQYINTIEGPAEPVSRSNSHDPTLSAVSETYHSPSNVHLQHENEGEPIWAIAIWAFFLVWSPVFCVSEYFTKVILRRPEGIQSLRFMLGTLAASMGLMYYWLG